MKRFSEAIGGNELEPPIEMKWLGIWDVVTDEDGEWRGATKFVYENQGWTVFDDSSGHLSRVSTSKWKEFSIGTELVFAGYNDTGSLGVRLGFRFSGVSALMSGLLFDARLCDAEKTKSSIS